MNGELSDDNHIVYGSGDLSECRHRLDEGIQENRRNRHVIEDLNDRLERYRRKLAAEVDETRRATPIFYLSSSQLDDERLLIDIADRNSGIQSQGSHLHPNDTHASSGSHPNIASSRPVLILPSPSSSSLPRYSSSPLLFFLDRPQEDSNSNGLDRICLDSLLRRIQKQLKNQNAYEEVIFSLQSENDHANAANEMLRVDVAELSVALEAVQTMRRREQKNHAEYVKKSRLRKEQNSKRLQFLQSLIKAHKIQLTDLASSTKSDLGKHQEEFEKISRFLKTAVMEDKDASSQMNSDDLLNKYETLLNKHSQCDKERLQQVGRLDQQLKKTADEKDALAEGLARVSDMPELNVQRESDMRHPRARSYSPAVRNAYIDVQRKIRAAIAAKTNDVRDLQTKLERAEKEILRQKQQVEKHQKEMKEREEHLLTTQEKKKNYERSDLERTIKRLEERIVYLEEEREKAFKEVNQHQISLNNTLRSHKEFIEELSARHREELLERISLLESDKSIVIQEQKIKTDRSREEAERAKAETERVRVSLREVNAQLAEVTQRCQENVDRVKDTEKELSAMREELERAQLKTEDADRETVGLKRELDSANEKIESLQKRITKITSREKDAMNTLKETSDEIQEWRSRCKQTEEDVEKKDAQLTEAHDKLSKAENAIHTKEKIIRTLRVSLSALETKHEEKNMELERLKAECDQVALRLDVVSKELSSTQQTCETIAREKDSVADSLSTCRNQNSDLEAKLHKTNQDLEGRSKEVAELQRLFNVVNEELKNREEQAEESAKTIDSLKEKISELEDELDQVLKRLADEKKESEEKKLVIDSLKEEVQEREIRYTKSLEAMKRTLGESAARITELEGLHERLLDEFGEAKLKNEELRERLAQKEMEWQSEMEKLVEANNVDREEWEAERFLLEKQKQSAMTALQEELAAAQDEASAIREGWKTTRAERDEAIEESQRIRGKMQDLKREVESHVQSIRQSESDSLQERNSLLTQVEQSELKVTRLNSLLEAAQRRSLSQEAELTRMQETLTQKSAMLLEVEVTLDGLADKLRQHQEQEHLLRDRLAIVERERNELKRKHDEYSLKEAELFAQINSLRDRIRELESKLQTTEVTLDFDKHERSERNEKMNALMRQVQKSDAQVVESIARMKKYSREVKELEDILQRKKAENQEKQIKIDEISHVNLNLQRALEQLQEEQSAVAKSMEKKSMKSRTTFDELLTRFKETDTLYLHAQTEIEHLKAANAELNDELDRSSSRRRDLESRLNASEARHAQLVTRLTEYEKAAMQSLAMAGGRFPSRSTTKTPYRMEAAASTADLHKPSLERDSPTLRASTSIHDISRFETEKNFRYHQPGEIDVSSSVDITIRYLKERIERLENDKASLMKQLTEQTRKAASADEVFLEQTRLRRELENVQAEKKSLETRLNSQRSLYLSHEEALASRDREFRSLRAKLANAEQRCRERDAHMQQITVSHEVTQHESHSMNTSSTSSAFSPEPISSSFKRAALPIRYRKLKTVSPRDAESSCGRDRDSEVNKRRRTITTFSVSDTVSTTRKQENVIVSTVI